MKKDLISIIVPVYNIELYIDECLSSIIKQTYKNIEIIIVNDGSTDNSLKVCKKYKSKDNRIKIFSKSNGGLSSARNYGIEKSKGKYISFIDGDDTVDKKYIETLYKCIVKDKTRMCVGNNYTIFSNGKKSTTALNKSYKISKLNALEKMLYVNDINVSACFKLYDRTLFDDITFPEGRLFEDTATTYKLIDKCDYISVASYPLYNYILKPGSITTEKFNIKKMDWIISSIEMTHYIKKKYPHLKDACTCYLMYAHIGTLSSLAMSNKDYKKERKELVEFVKINKRKYVKNENVPQNYKIVARLININYGLFKLFLKFYQKIVLKRYE